MRSPYALASEYLKLMKTEQTKERQYQVQVSLRDTKGLTRLGLVTNQVWHDDPRRLLFVLARYKFVAKMLSGKKCVLEVGCGDAWASRVVRQEVESLVGVDFDPVFVEDARAGMDPAWAFEVRVHDMLESPVDGRFDAAYALDVLEHIPASDEDRFIANISQSLAAPGVAMFGMPSL